MEGRRIKVAAVKLFGIFSDGKMHCLMRAVRNMRFEPEDTPPQALSLGLGMQMAGISVSGIIITPVVVINAAVLPIVYEMVTQGEDTSEMGRGAICALVTLLLSVALAMRARGALRLWTPMIGVLAGTLACAFLGLFDPTPIREAAWIGVPEVPWPGVALAAC